MLIKEIHKLESRENGEIVGRPNSLHFEDFRKEIVTKFPQIAKLSRVISVAGS